MRQLPFRVENFAGRNVDTKLAGSETQLAQPFDQFVLGHDPRTAPGKFTAHTLVNINCPTGPPQQKAAQQAAHRAANDYCASHVGPSQSVSLDLFVYAFILYMTVNSFGGIPMALTMLDKSAEKKEKTAWPADISAEFDRESKNPNPCVGSTLLSENERTRVWIIRLAPGERIGFHRHVLDYFWTSVSGGRGRQHVHDGTTVEYTYQPGETRHESYGKDEFKVHDLENLGDREMVFMTVEFKDSANKPMPLPAGVRPQSAAA
jgi:quercetin dioxygenase-like cupin family protein